MRDVVKILGIVSFSIFISCTNRTTKDEQVSFKLQKDYQYVHLVPDSLRTSEQQKLCDLILETIVHNLKVEDNHLVFSLSERAFLKSGIPKPYYDLLQQNLRDANCLIDSVGVKGMDSILNESYKQLYIRFKGKKD